jgi:hypothetical protein
MLRPKNASHPLDIPLKPKFTNAFWKILVKTRGLRGALVGLHGFTRKHPEVVAQTVQLMTEAMGASEVHDPELEALKEADAFWKQLVETVGKPRAKQIMQFVMDEKKTGRSGDLMLPLISNYIRVWGLEESDEKIAKRIIESKPYYAKCAKGHRVVVNDWLTEELLSDETIVARTPIDKGLPAMKKHVERVRRWLIEEKILPKEYAPKQYYRD